MLKVLNIVKSIKIVCIHFAKGSVTCGLADAPEVKCGESMRGDDAARNCTCDEAGGGCTRSGTVGGGSALGGGQFS